jgi:hypothetical protein
MLGGYGPCGRPLCCTTWLKTFEPVSIKMAKLAATEPEPVEAVGDVRAAQVLPALRASQRQWREACRLRRPRQLLESNGLRSCATGGGCGSCGHHSVAITVGIPAGIGPEIALKAAADPRVRDVCLAQDSVLMTTAR